MPKRSSEKNNRLLTAIICAVLLLCLGGSFILSSVLRKSGGSAPAVNDQAQQQSFIPLKATAAYENTVSVSAKSAILIEARSGEVIWQKDADRRMPMASTTKIMTALVALDSGDVGRTVSVSKDAVGIEGSSIYLYPEEELTLLELIYAMMLESANDAAAAIAIEVGGSVEGFAALMNKKADELGLKDTHFTNPHGLDDPEHYTTARELAIIASEAYENDSFREIVSTYKKTIPLNETEGVRLLVNHNKMLKRYDGAVGIKTGFTKKSGRCLVSAAERGGAEFIAVTLSAPDDWNDHTKLLDLAYSLYEARTLCEKGEFQFTIPAIGGTENYIIAENTEKITLTLPKGRDDIEYIIELPRFIFAPTESGEKVGDIVFFIGKDEITRVPIVAKTSAEQLKYKKGLFG